MTDRNQSPVPYDQNVGLIKSIINQGRLVFSLLGDGRVPIWLKTLPLGALVYLISPIDLVPDAILLLGQLDDIAVVALGLKVFIEMAPRNVVDEHMRKIMDLPPDYEVDDTTPAAVSDDATSLNRPADDTPIIDGEYEDYED